MELAAPGRRVHAPSDLAVRHIRTQIDTPWTNGKFESFWATPQAEVLDRRRLENVAEADAAARAFGVYCNYHRLHGELDWHTPAERFNGTPFTDRGLDHVPLLASALPILNRWLPSTLSW